MKQKINRFNFSRSDVKANYRVGGTEDRARNSKCDTSSLSEEEINREQNNDQVKAASNCSSSTLGPSCCQVLLSQKLVCSGVQLHYCLLKKKKRKAVK